VPADPLECAILCFCEYICRLVYEMYIKNDNNIIIQLKWLFMNDVNILHFAIIHCYNV